MISFKNFIFFACLALATITQAPPSRVNARTRGQVRYQPSYTSDPQTQWLTKITGIPEAHLKPGNLTGNLIPHLATQGLSSIAYKNLLLKSLLFKTQIQQHFATEAVMHFPSDENHRTLGQIVDEARNIQEALEANGEEQEKTQSDPHARLPTAKEPRSKALATLEFPPGSQPTPEEIKKAYRKLSLREHPDKNGNTDAAKLKFQEITDANTYLTKSKREAVSPEDSQDPRRIAQFPEVDLSIAFTKLITFKFLNNFTPLGKESISASASKQKNSTVAIGLKFWFFLRTIGLDIAKYFNDSHAKATEDGDRAETKLNQHILDAAIPFIHILPEFLLRKHYIKKLTDQNMLIHSKKIPEDMIGKQYLIIQGTESYLLRNAFNIFKFLFCLIQKCRSRSLSDNNHTTFFKRYGAEFNMLLKAPAFPHIFILRSDCDKLPKEDQMFLYAAMKSDANEILSGLVALFYKYGTRISQWKPNQKTVEEPMEKPTGNIPPAPPAAGVPPKGIPENIDPIYPIPTPLVAGHIDDVD